MSADAALLTVTVTSGRIATVFGCLGGGEPRRPVVPAGACGASFFGRRERSGLGSGFSTGAISGSTSGTWICSPSSNPAPGFSCWSSAGVEWKRSASASSADV